MKLEFDQNDKAFNTVLGSKKNNIAYSDNANAEHCAFLELLLELTLNQNHSRHLLE